MTLNLFKKKGIVAAYYLFTISTVFVVLVNFCSATKFFPSLDSYSTIEQMHLPLEQFFFAVVSDREKDKQEIETKFNIFYSRFALHAYDSPRSHDFMKSKEYRDVMATLIQDVDFFQKNIATLRDLAVPEKSQIIEKMLGMRSMMFNLSNIVYEIQIEQYQKTLDHLFWNRLALAIYIAAVVCSGVLLCIGMRHKSSSNDL
ncbi:hypothetical protein [Herbaspirillum sp. RV1423]|uniref:hypothetical protein n=1 Tax=Herbaspirillum sp. RV1423 TaxID=1443993 RepID=UPI000556896C|nr:hypothetical protein [Herbaspirillum sp. RV1423]